MLDVSTIVGVADAAALHIQRSLNSRDARRVPGLRPSVKKKSHGLRGFSGFQSVQSAQSVAYPSLAARIVFGNGRDETAIAEGKIPTG